MSVNTRIHMKKITPLIFPLAFLAALMPFRAFADETISSILKSNTDFPASSVLWQAAAADLANEDYTNASNKLLAAGNVIIRKLATRPLAAQVDDLNVISRNKKAIARARLAYTTARTALDLNADTGVQPYVNTVLLLLDDAEMLLNEDVFEASTWSATLNVALASIDFVSTTTGRKDTFDTIITGEENPDPVDVNTINVREL